MWKLYGNRNNIENIFFEAEYVEAKYLCFA